MEELGVLPGMNWTMVDWWRKVRWGKQRGISKCALILVRIYEQLRPGKTDEATAQTVQGMKALKQVSLDEGDWTKGWELTGLRDLTRPERFAGDFQEMTGISAYLKSLRELEGACRVGDQPHLSDEEPRETNKQRKIRLDREKKEAAAKRQASDK